MMDKINPLVVIFEYQDIRFASRARKEAFTLAQNGFDVTLIGFNKSITKLKTEKSCNVNLLQFPYYSQIPWGQKAFNVFILNTRVLLHFFKYKYDIYHLHSLKVCLPVILIKIFTRRILVYDAHELNISKRVKDNIRNSFFTHLDRIEEKILNRFANIVIQASEERARFYGLYYKVRRPFAINNYANKENNFDHSINLKKSLNIVNENKLLVFTGNISIGGSQNVVNIIKALTFVSGIDLCLLGAIQDKVKKELIMLAQSLKVLNRLHIHSPVLSEEVVSTISTADIAIVPVDADCLNTKYSALNKLSQSLMAGLPVLGSNLSVISNTILYNPIGVVGDVFDVKSPESIAAAIERLLKDDINDMKKNARELALSNINWEVEGYKLIKIYKNLVNM